MIDRSHINTLMARAADGERDAIDPLFHALWPTVVAYAKKLAGDLGEDVAQESLVQLFGQLDRYDRSRDALAWTLALTTWQARTACKRQQRRAECDALPTPTLDGKTEAEERELVHAALETLATLSPRDREVIAAVITDDDALRSALEPATFRKRLERALARLRLSWRSRHGTL